MEVYELHEPVAATVSQEPHDDQSRNQLTITQLLQSSRQNLQNPEHQYSAPLDDVIAIEVSRYLLIVLCTEEAKLC